MDPEDQLNIDELIAPISEDAPCGQDIREDSSPTSPYYQLKDLRSAARDAERRHESGDDPDLEPPDWQPILDLAPRVLREKSKDLEITAWYIEALLRREGFAGLRDGFKLARVLVETYWDDLYPTPVDGLEDKVAPLTGLNGYEGDGTLILPIRRAAITAEGSHGTFAYWHYQRAHEIERIEDEEKREKLIQSGVVTLKEFNQTVRESGADFYLRLIDELTSCLAEFTQLTDLMTEKCGDEAPPSSTIRNTLQDFLDTVRVIAEPILPIPADDTPVDDGTDGVDGVTLEPSSRVGSASGAFGQGQIANREDALKALLKVSEFFRRTEPHSPIAYQLEQVVRWSRMTLPELARELIVDDSTRNTFFALTGIKPDGDE